MSEDSELPLTGLVVVDMSQFLSGPYCSLRLLDLGARVIKIERPDGGDLSRRLYLSDTEIGGQPFRRGDAVVPLMAAANRDPEVFDRPGDFDILRARLQKAVDQVLGKGEARVTLASVIVFQD